MRRGIHGAFDWDGVNGLQMRRLGSVVPSFAYKVEVLELVQEVHTSC
jgi:hypothetical protein